MFLHEIFDGAQVVLLFLLQANTTQNHSTNFEEPDALSSNHLVMCMMACCDSKQQRCARKQCRLDSKSSDEPNTTVNNCAHIFPELQDVVTCSETCSPLDPVDAVAPERPTITRPLFSVLKRDFPCSKTSIVFGAMQTLMSMPVRVRDSPVTATI
jgi:hypothetical protein